MIGVGAPWMFGAAVFAALATCVLHFLSVRRPPVLLLPTMRFLPERPVRAVSRNARPSDLFLLLLRVLALLLLGVALSGLYWRGSGIKHGRVVVLQAANSGDVLGTQNAVTRALSGAFAADTVTRIVVMDTTAHMLSAAQTKAFKAETISAPMKGANYPAASLSAAILTATRAASALVREERNVDAVDLVIVAPFVRNWKDAAFPAVRATWPGAIRLFNASPVVDSTNAYVRRLALVGGKASEAVVSALEVRGWTLSNSGTSYVQTASAVPFVPISLEWPASGAPEGWTASNANTVGAIIARGEALVFPFERVAHIPDAILAQGRALAWWSDGEVAAVELPTSTSCTRHVGIAVPPSSDVLQGQAARALLQALSGPCGGERDVGQLSEGEVRDVSGTGLAAPATTFKSNAVIHTPWAPLWLILAIALLICEWFVRDREDRITDAIEAHSSVARRVA
ncbi:MAG: hypothetical protein ABJB74_23550 [Gemmatimonas sp.]